MLLSDNPCFYKMFSVSLLKGKIIARMPICISAFILIKQQLVFSFNKKKVPLVHMLNSLHETCGFKVLRPYTSQSHC